MDAGCVPRGGVYRARAPRQSALYRCVASHAGELIAGGGARRSIERDVLERFLDCGDLHKGFARVRCERCGHDYLLAFSCKTRCFCPSCHQKRMLLHGERIEEAILAPVPHRQYVFTVPKALRGHFRADRVLLGELCRLVARLVRRFYRAAAPAGVPAFVLYVQTYGDLVTWNPHVHALVADGVFHRSGTFQVLPPLPEDALREALRHELLRLLVERRCFDVDFAARLLSWRHSGFSVHNRVRVRATDAEGRRHLARYMIRPPFSLEKMRYDEASATVIYRSRLHATLKRNFQLLPGARWLALVLQHVPDRYEHLVRYYGHYSSRSRGQRAKRAAKPGTSLGPPALLERPEPGTSRAARASWARLIQKVYEADPLLCPRCAGPMRVIALIEDEPVIERILRHLGAYRPRPPGPGPPADPSDWPPGAQLPVTYHPVPDIA